MSALPAQIAFSVLGEFSAAGDIRSKNLEIAMKEAYNQSLYTINELALKATYQRNVRANMLSEGINLGRQATALAKANIGVAGTTVPAFGAIMARTDWDNQGYELNKVAQLGRLAVSKSASRAATREAKNAPYGRGWFGSILNTIGGHRSEDMGVHDA